MSCQDVQAPSCPCVLAEINECSYCSLLQGKEVCGCNWRGYCVYEWYQADRNPAAAISPNTIVAVYVHPSSLGLVVSSADTCVPPLGACVKLALSATDSQTIDGIVLRRFSADSLFYLCTFVPLASESLPGQRVHATTGGNAFLGHQTLETAKGKTIALTSSSLLTGPLSQLASHLTQRDNRVRLTTLEAIDFNNTDIVFLAGTDSEIKRVATKLPSDFNGTIATWLTTYNCHDGCCQRLTQDFHHPA